MTDRLTSYTWAIAIAIVLCMVGPTLDAIDEAKAALSSATDARNTAQQRGRFERAAQAMCGENAGWRELGDGAVQCMTKRGYRTGVVQVVTR